ncbi:aldehyde dehydrogenase family protein [Kitasatospora acidiphila]|uniref:aldehyde dehydrogenase family protein n=1 Tax=Kitasatospora acidiphila TaxID=2567942 RepID=UPI003C7404D6
MTARSRPPVPEQQLTDQWIGGRWQASTAEAAIEVVDPSTELRIATVPAGTAADADRAARAAAAAFDGWAATPVPVRAKALRRIVEGLTRRADRFAELITAEVGAPVRVARRTQVGLAIGMAAHSLDLLDGFAFERRIGNSLVVHEPAGVAACITPWNMPLLLTVQKVLPALAAGCTVVLKPSEITPLHAYLLTELIAEADLPPGVFNLVVGTGPEAGAALAGHPLVDTVSLTGSTRAGRDVAARGAATVKRVHLELGGKGASVVLDEESLEDAVRATVDQVCFNSGQSCLQWSRLLVPARLEDEALALAVEAIADYRVGDPREESTDLGPLVSAAAMARVTGHISRGLADGARLVAGGPGRPDGLDRGYFVRPTVFAGVSPDAALAQEEVFGPVLCVLPYQDEEDAVRIANGTEYGLHSSVWAGRDRRAERFARRLRTGLVDLNGGPFNPAAPFGGFKQSGLGRECGTAGLEAFLEVKSLQFPQDSGGPLGPRLKDTAPRTEERTSR